MPKSASVIILSQHLFLSHVVLLHWKLMFSFYTVYSSSYVTRAHKEVYMDVLANIKVANIKFKYLYFSHFFWIYIFTS